jgi:hypothetical protein
LNVIVVIESAQESSLMSKMKALLLAGAIAVTVITVKAQQAGTESANGLRISLAHDEAASGPDKALHFTVTFSNLEEHEVTIAPGMLNCLKPPSKTSAITLNLTDDRGKRHRHLPYWGDGPPYQGGMACGHMIPFVAVLHPGESLSLPLDIGKYLDLADSKGYADVKFPAGKYSMQAELRYRPPESSVLRRGNWTGTISSNIIEVNFESEFAAPLDDYPRKSDAESRSPR